MTEDERFLYNIDIHYIDYYVPDDNNATQVNRTKALWLIKVFGAGRLNKRT